MLLHLSRTPPAPCSTATCRTSTRVTRPWWRVLAVAAAAAPRETRKVWSGTHLASCLSRILSCAMYNPFWMAFSSMDLTLVSFCFYKHAETMRSPGMFGERIIFSCFNGFQPPGGPSFAEAVLSNSGGKCQPAICLAPVRGNAWQKTWQSQCWAGLVFTNILVITWSIFVHTHSWYMHADAYVMQERLQKIQTTASAAYLAWYMMNNARNYPYVVSNLGWSSLCRNNWPKCKLCTSHWLPSFQKQQFTRKLWPSPLVAYMLEGLFPLALLLPILESTQCLSYLRATREAIQKNFVTATKLDVAMNSLVQRGKNLGCIHAYLL